MKQWLSNKWYKVRHRAICADRPGVGAIYAAWPRWGRMQMHIHLAPADTGETWCLVTDGPGLTAVLLGFHGALNDLKTPDDLRKLAIDMNFERKS